MTKELTLKKNTGFWPKNGNSLTEFAQKGMAAIFHTYF